MHQSTCSWLQFNAYPANRVCRFYNGEPNRTGLRVRPPTQPADEACGPTGHVPVQWAQFCFKQLSHVQRVLSARRALFARLVGVN